MKTLSTLVKILSGLIVILAGYLLLQPTYVLVEAKLFIVVVILMVIDIIAFMALQLMTHRQKLAEKLAEKSAAIRKNLNETTTTDQIKQTEKD